MVYPSSSSWWVVVLGSQKVFCDWEVPVSQMWDPWTQLGLLLAYPRQLSGKSGLEILGLEDYWKLHLPRPAILKPGASESSPEGFNTPNCWVNDSKWGQKQQCSVSSGDGILYNCAQIVFWRKALLCYSGFLLTSGNDIMAQGLRGHVILWWLQCLAREKNCGQWTRQTCLGVWWLSIAEDCR